MLALNSSGKVILNQGAQEIQSDAIGYVNVAISGISCVTAPTDISGSYVWTAANGMSVDTAASFSFICPSSDLSVGPGSYQNINLPTPLLVIKGTSSGTSQASYNTNGQTNLSTGLAAPSPSVYAFGLNGLFITWGCPALAPATPVTGSVTGGNLPAQCYSARTAYVTSSGESMYSGKYIVGNTPLAAGELLTIASPSASYSATGWNVYVGYYGGDFVYARQNATPIPFGTNWTIPTTGLVAGPTPSSTPLLISVPTGLTVTSAANTSGATIAASTTITYEVTAITAAGETTPCSSVSTTTAPKTVNNSAILNWTAVPGSTGYKIYGRTSGSLFLIGTTVLTSFVDLGTVAPSGAPPTSNTAELAAPPFMNLGSVAGGTLGDAQYAIEITYVNSSGETKPYIRSNSPGFEVLDNNRLIVYSPPASPPATGWNVYVVPIGGNLILQNSTPIAIGTGWTENTMGLIAGTVVGMTPSKFFPANGTFNNLPSSQNTLVTGGQMAVTPFTGLTPTYTGTSYYPYNSPQSLTVSGGPVTYNGIGSSVNGSGVTVPGQPIPTSTTSPWGGSIYGGSVCGGLTYTGLTYNQGPFENDVFGSPLLTGYFYSSDGIEPTVGGNGNVNEIPTLVWIPTPAPTYSPIGAQSYYVTQTVDGPPEQKTITPYQLTSVAASPVAPASAPTLSTGNPVPTHEPMTLYVVCTYVNAQGETPASSESSIVLGATDSLLVTAPPTLTNGAPVSGWNVYVSLTSGSEKLQNMQQLPLQVYNSPTSVTSYQFVQPTYPPTTSGASPPTVNTAIHSQVPSMWFKPTAFGNTYMFSYDIFVGNTSSTMTKQNTSVIPPGTQWTMPPTGMTNTGAAPPADNGYQSWDGYQISGVITLQVGYVGLNMPSASLNGLTTYVVLSIPTSGQTVIYFKTWDGNIAGTYTAQSPYTLPQTLTVSIP